MLKQFVALISILVSVVLFSLNAYGLIKGMRAPSIYSAELRFKNDVSYNYTQAIEKFQQFGELKDSEKVAAFNGVVSKSLAHIPWYEETDPVRFNQLVPIYENFILYMMGKFSGIPEFTKYHFTDYHRSLSRGIGICGDASMVLSQVLIEHGIKSKIVSLDSHVVVEVELDKDVITADPDFGVVLPYSVKEIASKQHLVSQYYSTHGYSEGDIQALSRAFSSPATYWKDSKHFMTNKYYFERVSYFLKWLIPIMLLIVGTLVLKRNRPKGKS